MNLYLNARIDTETLIESLAEYSYDRVIEFVNDIDKGMCDVDFSTALIIKLLDGYEYLPEYLADIKTKISEMEK